MSNINIEEKLSKTGKLFCNIRGKSMIPMLYPKRDFAIIELKKKIKKNDVALFKTQSGQYILHRVIKVKNNCYDFRGDNNFTKEKNIEETQIVGVLTEFIRNGKKISTNSFLYKLLSRLWKFSFPIRIICYKFKKYLMS